MRVMSTAAWLATAKDAKGSERNHWGDHGVHSSSTTKAQVGAKANRKASLRVLCALCVFATNRFATIDLRRLHRKLWVNRR